MTEDGSVLVLGEEPEWDHAADVLVIGPHIAFGYVAARSITEEHVKQLAPRARPLRG